MSVQMPERSDGHEAADPARRNVCLLTGADLLATPAPSWLIDHLLPSEGLSVLWGPPGHYKTFVALGWALSIASGQAWLGQEVRQGPTIYVTGEGKAGLGQRYAAWLAAHELLDVVDVRFVTDALNFLDRGDTQALRDAIATLDCPPALVVVDTLARSMPGGDENSARDVGAVIAACESLSPASLLIHHAGIDGERERGSTALRGAAAMMTRAKRGGPGRFSIRCTKMRDGREFEDIHLDVARVATSLVLTLAAPQQPDEPEDSRPDLILDALRKADEPLSFNKLDQKIPGRRQDVLKAVYRLRDTGAIVHTSSGWEVVPSDWEPPRNHISAQTASGVVPEGGLPEGRPLGEPPAVLRFPEAQEPAWTGDTLAQALIDVFDAVELEEGELR